MGGPHSPSPPHLLNGDFSPSRRDQIYPHPCLHHKESLQAPVLMGFFVIPSRTHWWLHRTKFSWIFFLWLQVGVECVFFVFVFFLFLALFCLCLVFCLCFYLLLSFVKSLKCFLNYKKYIILKLLFYTSKHKLFLN